MFRSTLTVDEESMAEYFGVIFLVYRKEKMQKVYEIRFSNILTTPSNPAVSMRFLIFFMDTPTGALNSIACLGTNKATVVASP